MGNAVGLGPITGVGERDGSATDVIPLAGVGVAETVALGLGRGVDVTRVGVAVQFAKETQAV